MTTLVNILIATVIVSLVSLIGVIFLYIHENLIKKIAVALVAFASGSLIGGAFFHLIPEALELNNDRTFPIVIVGILSFLVMEKFLCWRHCHEDICDVHSFTYLNLFGDGVHNFLDGMIIAASFMVNTEIGIVTTLVILFHEVPQELGDFGVLIYGGFSRIRALLYNLLSALTAVIGGVFAYYFSMHVMNLSEWLLPFAAGGFIYIALVDLIPELHKRRKPKEAWWQFALILFGIVVLYSATFIHHN